MSRHTLKAVFLTTVLYILSACTSSSDYLPTMSVVSEAMAADTYVVGETSVKIVTTRFGSGGSTFIALHENESTAVRAAKEVLRQKGGVLVELKHGGTRNLQFRYQGKTYTVDPNRIFTDAGIRKTLTGDYSSEVHQVVKGLAAAILSRLSRSVIVSLHNNTDGNYSIDSYKPGKQYARDVSALHIEPDKDKDDFFFVTDIRSFVFLKSEGFSVALQSSAGNDDGSLSVYCLRHGIAYLNVEAQNGHLSEQKIMIETLLK